MTSADTTTRPRAEPTADLLRTIGVAADRIDGHLADTYVLEAIEHLDRVGIDPAWLAQRCSLLLIKPDAIVARAVEPTLEWLTENGWQVRHSALVPADRHLARALWANSWATASPERRRLADLLVGICDAIVLVVTDTASAVTDTASAVTDTANSVTDSAGTFTDVDPDSVGPRSATERLTEEKGPTRPSDRRPGQLRHRLGRHSYLLNLVHTPDTPVDVLREWAIMFDEPARDRCLAALGDGSGESRAVAHARELADELYRRVPAYSFDPTAALARIRADLGEPVAAGRAGDGDATAAELLTAAWEIGASPDPWSVIVLGSYVLPMAADPRMRRQPETSRVERTR